MTSIVDLPPEAPDPPDSPADRAGLDRRGFLTFVVAAPTLAVAVRYGLASTPAQAAIPGSPEPADSADLGDYLILAGKPTEGQLIVLVAEPDGSVSCALPREEVGQGITTAVAMLLADELGLPLAKVHVTVANARPELLFNQLTGGSNTIRSVYQPVKAAAQQFRARMGAAAAARWGISTAGLRIVDGAVVAPDGRSAGYGELAAAAADPALATPATAPPARSSQPVVGTPQSRQDALAMVTGRQKYTLDLDPVPGALRAIVRRPETIRGSVKRIVNEAAIRAMPGVVDLVVIETGRTAFQGTDVVESGVAVVAETFGQALDAKEALEVEWNPSPVAAENDDSIRAKLRGIQPPFSTPVPPLAGVVEGEFDFAFVSHAPLESNTAIAHVRGGKADVWAGCKTPVVAQQTIARVLGLAEKDVTLHVVQGGGSFGRRLFFDSALEAARISKAVGKPVKLLWTRVDDMRHGRARAASSHRIRLTHAGGNVLSFEQRVASVETDFRHGLGEVLTAIGSQMNPPSSIPLSAGGNATFSQSVFASTVRSPYQFGATHQALNELSLPFNTGSWRSVYSANTRGAEEIMVDEVAAAMGKDPAAFRLEFLSDERQRAVLRKAMELGGWGRPMPAGTAQGIAFHQEYKSLTACLVELDARTPSAPRVTKAAIAADYGLPINPRGLEAQLLGGLTDAIGTTLRAGLHLVDGLFLEGSYSQFHFPRQRDIPRDLQIYIFPMTTGEPGGAGELGVPAAVGAIANAYARATGTKPRRFPIVFPVDFKPFPKGTGSTRVQPR